MALPNGAGGYQLGDGNLNEAVMGYAPVPATATSTATLTAAQVLSGILLGSPGSSAASYTLPTVADLEATLSSAKVGSTFNLSVVNVDGSGSGVITLVAGTGITVYGSVTVPRFGAYTYKFVKTGDATWSAFLM